MPPLPIISGRRCVGALSKVGFVLTRQRGTLRAIIRQAGLTVEEFVSLL